MYNIHEKDCYGDKRKCIVKKKNGRTDRHADVFPWIIFILVNTVAISFRCAWGLGVFSLVFIVELLLWL